jgi:hypothetical protein
MSHIDEVVVEKLFFILTTNSDDYSKAKELYYLP